jgi:hypothetical protein
VECVHRSQSVEFAAVYMTLHGSKWKLGNLSALRQEKLKLRVATPSRCKRSASSSTGSRFRFKPHAFVDTVTPSLFVLGSSVCVDVPVLASCVCTCMFTERCRTGLRLDTSFSLQWLVPHDICTCFTALVTHARAKGY